MQDSSSQDRFFAEVGSMRLSSGMDMSFAVSSSLYFSCYLVMS
jgi:hypothetical protein